MSLRRQKAKDSLDLLLDTMCNTFGGIILIAILVALLAGGRLQLAAPTSSMEVSKLRAQAAAELQRLQNVSSQLRLQIQSGGLDRKVELIQLREELQAQITTLNRQLKIAQTELRQLEKLDPNERKAALTAEIDQVVAQARAIQAKTDGLNREVSARQQTLARMQQETQVLLDSSILSLRYPKERETGKLRYYVLVKYGRLYPTEFPGGGRNRDTIDWTEMFDSQIARPRSSAGIDPMVNPTGADSLFAALNPASQYVAFVVFPDSFVAYGAAQQLCVRHHLEFGWSPTTDAAVVFSSTGKNPLPQ